MRGAARVVGAVVLLVLVVLLLPRGTLGGAADRLSALPWYGVPVLLALQSASLALLGLQWTQLLRASAPRTEITWRAVMTRYLGGSFVESATPSAKVGGEAARLLLFRQRFRIGMPQLGTAAAVHALAMLAGIAVLVPVAVLLGGGAALAALTGLGRLELTIWLLGAVAVLGAASLVLRRVAQRLRVVAPERRTVAAVVGIAAVVWVLYPTKVVLAAHLLGVTAPVPALVVATFAAYVVGLAPLTPGGVGGYEATMVGALVAAGVSSADAAALTVLSRAVSFGWPLLLSGFAAAGIAGARSGEAEASSGQGETMPRERFSAMRAVQVLEQLAGGSRLFAAVYVRLFYRAMVEREYRTAGLKRGDRVLQLGAGPFPMTALALAELGCHVTAVDRDKNALAYAERALQSREAADLPGSVVLYESDGLQLSYSGYTAVMVALHVRPKAAVLRRILETADPETRVLYRNPRALLRGAYERITPGQLGLSQIGRIAKLPGSKELVMVRKPANLSAHGEIPSMPCAECALCDLAPRQLGTIAYAPNLPALAALGVRAGKTCSLVAAQPWGGPVICSVGGRQVALERSIAARIGVTPAGTDNAEE